MWMALWEEKATRELAEGRLAKKCDEATDLCHRCTELETMARDARAWVAPLEKKVNDLKEVLVREAKSGVPSPTGTRGSWFGSTPC